MSSQVADRRPDDDSRPVLALIASATATRSSLAFEVQSSVVAGVGVITVIGELDAAAAPALDEHLRQTAQGEGAVLVDLSAVGFLDSSGIRSLLLGYRSITGQARRFAVACRSGSAPMRALELTRLDMLIEHHPDRGQAIDALRAPTIQAG